MFKDVCTNPNYDEELECVCEPGNLSDPYMVAVKREISGDAVIIGCVLDQYLQYILYL